MRADVRVCMQGCSDRCAEVLVDVQRLCYGCAYHVVRFVRGFFGNSWLGDFHLFGFRGTWIRCVP